MFLYSPGLDLRPGQARRIRSGQTAGNSTTWNGVGGLHSPPLRPGSPHSEHGLLALMNAPTHTGPAPPQPSPCPPPPPPPRAGPVHMQPHRQPPSRDSFQKQNLLNYKWPASASIMNQIKDPLEESSGQLLGGARRNYSRLPLPLALSLKDPTACEGAHLFRTCQASDVGLTEPRLFVFPC